MIAGYGTFLRIAERAQWDDAAIDLSADATAWGELGRDDRDTLLRLLAGFHVGEAQVAAELGPFRAACSGDAAACFAVQEHDEARHARFFDRVATEVAGVPGGSVATRRDALRPLLDPAFVALFETRLPETSAALAAGSVGVSEAVGLYHMVLEGVVFSAGLLASLEALERLPLPGWHAGVSLVLRDERWHVGFGTRCLQDAGVSGADADAILAAGEHAAGLWAPPAIAAKTTHMLRRRLGSLRRAAAAPA